MFSQYSVHSRSSCCDPGKTQRPGNHPRFKPWTGYMCFVIYNRPQLRKDHPEGAPKDMLRLAAQKWNALAAAEKEKWTTEARLANLRRDHDPSSSKQFQTDRQFDMAQKDCVNLTGIVDFNTPSVAQKMKIAEEERERQEREGTSNQTDTLNNQATSGRLSLDLMSSAGGMKDEQSDDDKKVIEVPQDRKERVDALIEVYTGDKANSVIKRFDEDRTKMDNALEVIGENIPVPMPSADNEDKEMEEDEEGLEIVRSGRTDARGEKVVNGKVQVEVLSEGEDGLSVTNDMEMPREDVMQRASRAAGSQMDVQSLQGQGRDEDSAINLE